MSEEPVASAGPQPPRVTYACEACRAAKLRCTASAEQLGICQRCLEHKKECIFKTGPRTRRPRRSKLSDPAHISPLPPPPGPSRTFTIDIDLPDDDDATDGLAALLEAHEGYIDAVVPLASVVAAPSPGSPSTFSPAPSSSCPRHSRSSGMSTPTPAGSTAGGGAGAGGGGRPMTTLGVQPLFNIGSATQLLLSFRAMLHRFPCLLLAGDETVGSLARERPFVLLAILAAASAGRAVGGRRSLYDEEFRKVLGLKFVAGGERSLDLLVGLLVYCAWHPSHLRPNFKVSLQYVRMACDIVTDLELDQDFDEDGDDEVVTAHRLAQLRAYLACFYLTSGRASTFPTPCYLPYTSYLAKCCDVLETHAEVPADRLLAWLVRYEHINSEITSLRKTEMSQPPHQTVLMLRGMAAQLSDWEQLLPADLASEPTLQISHYFSTAYLHGSPLLSFPMRKHAKSPSNHPTALPTSPLLFPHPPPSSSSPPKPPPAPIDPHSLRLAIPPVRALFDTLLALPDAAKSHLTQIDFARTVLCLVFAFRLSFPLPACPAWDVPAARAALDFAAYLDRLCGGSGPDDDYEAPPPTTTGEAPSQPARPTTLDVWAATQAVLRIVRRKYRARMDVVAAAEAAAAARGSSLASSSGSGAASILDDGRGPPPLPQLPVGCPVLDGSMAAFWKAWEAAEMGSDLDLGVGVGGVVPGAAGGGLQPQVQDLWGAMTTDWVGEGAGDMDFGGI